MRVRVLAFQPLGVRGGGQAKTKPRKETISINKVGGQTDGRREAAPDWVSSQINRGRHGQRDGRTHVRRPRRTGFLHRLTAGGTGRGTDEHTYGGRAGLGFFTE